MSISFGVLFQQPAKDPAYILRCSHAGLWPVFGGLLDPLVDLTPHVTRERLVVAGMRDEHEALRTGKRREDALGMRGTSIGVVCSVNQEDRNRDTTRGVDGAHGVDHELAVPFSNAEGGVYGAARQKERRALPRDGSKIRKDLGSNDRRDAPVVGGLLERHRGTERRPEQDDRPRPNAVDDVMKVAFFEEPVGARIPIRFSVRATVVGDDVETAARISLNDSARA